MSKKNLLFLTIAVVLLLGSSCSVFPQNDVQYIENYLEEEYTVDFVFLHSERQNNDKTIYYFSPFGDDTIIVETSTGYSYDSGMINTLLPFEKHRWVKENFVDKIKEKIIPVQTIDVEQFTLLSASDYIYSLMNSLNEELKAYGIETTKYSCAISIDVLADGNYHTVTFYALDKDVIVSQLEQFYK